MQPFTAPFPRHRTVAAVLACLFALGVGSAFAMPPTGGPGSFMLESRIRALDLDTTTRNAVFAILDGSRPTERELETRVQEEHESMRALLHQASPDENAVLAQAERVGATMIELRKQQLRTLLAVRAQLSPEQQAELAPPEHHAMRGGCGERFGRGRPKD